MKDSISIMFCFSEVVCDCKNKSILSCWSGDVREWYKGWQMMSSFLQESSTFRDLRIIRCVFIKSLFKKNINQEISPRWCTLCIKDWKMLIVCFQQNPFSRGLWYIAKWLKFVFNKILEIVPLKFTSTKYDIQKNESTGLTTQQQPAACHQIW